MVGELRGWRMIHYHGTPISPRAGLLEMAGRHFCVSFARPDDAEVCLRIGQSVLWDNGAFSFKTKGRPVDWGKYYRWLEPGLTHPHWAIIPDVIDGGAEEQRALRQTWPYDQLLGAPVWHMGLPFDYLAELADEVPRICFGSSGQYWQIGSTAWERRCDQAFNHLAQRQRSLPWIHMLRGLGLAGQRWPFASADSTNLGRNHKRNGQLPEQMADRIDRVQSPGHWKRREIQTSLFAEPAP